MCARRNQGCFRRFANFRILKMSLLWKVISCDIFTQMRLLNAPWVGNLSYSQIKTSFIGFSGQTRHNSIKYTTHLCVQNYHFGLMGLAE